MQHYLEVQNQKQLDKIEMHLIKYINVFSPAWVQTDGQFRKLQFPKFRERVKRYLFQCLFVTNNNYPNLLKDIGGGQFQYLIMLNLSNNSITSVQILPKFDTPSLQSLVLDRNLLTNLCALRKFIRKGLKILQIQMNHLNDITSLVQFDCPALKVLSLNNNYNVGTLTPFMKANMSPQFLNLKWDSQDLWQEKNTLIPVEDGLVAVVYPKLRFERLFFILNLVNSMTEAAIAQTWQNINQVLDLQCGRFHIKQLSNRKWYLQTLSILFPFLNEQWNKISTQIQTQQAAIDRILLVLVQQGIIPQDYLSEIRGRNFVIADQDTIMNMVELIKELIEQALQQGQQDGEEEGEEGQEEQQNQQAQVEEHEQYEEKNNSYERNTPEEAPNTKNKMVVTTIKADSQPDFDRDRNIHSVQGIGNQFQDKEEEENGSEELGNSGHPSKGYNIYPQSNSNKPLKQTNYKNEEQDQQEAYLNQKLIKCKSEEKLKNLPINRQKNEKRKKQKKVRVLVAHPTIKKQYNKATNQAEKKLSSTVKHAITVTRQMVDKENLIAKSPTAKDYLERKKRYLNYFTSAPKAKQSKKEPKKDKSMANLKKLLKWKQTNLKRQQRQLQQDIQMKVQLKKETYVKKINKLILKLEKEKMLDRRRQEHQRQKQERELADKRLQAIQQQYRNQMSLLHSTSPTSKKGVAHIDHRAIIESLQRDLKRQNQKQINHLKTKLRREQAQLDDDLQTLQKEIVRAYKRH